MVGESAAAPASRFVIGPPRGWVHASSRTASPPIDRTFRHRRGPRRPLSRGLLGALRPGREPLRRPGVGDALRVDPGLLGVARRVLDALQLLGAVRVAGQHERDVARRARGAAPRPTVEPRQRRRSPRAPCRSPRRRRSTASRSSSIGGRAADHARRQVADHAHGRVLHRRHDAARSAPRGRGRSGRAPRRGTSRSRGGTRGRSRARRSRPMLSSTPCSSTQRVAELRAQRRDARALLEQRLAADAGHACPRRGR